MTTTVPRTSFDIDLEEWKLFCNLMDAGTEAIKRNNMLRAMHCIAEAKSILAKYPQSSLAGHMHKRVAVLFDAISFITTGKRA